MHLQVKTNTGGTGFPGDDRITTTREYERGSLVRLLAILDDDFNIRGASGSRIEFDGELTFWAQRKNGDDDTDQATRDAADLLIEHGYDAVVLEVSVERLKDEPGALLAFIQEITDSGRWVEELTVGTPDPDGLIPVQALTSST
jgi:hypothetical protein